MTEPNRHKVFVSYHHGLDQAFRDRFVQMMRDDIVDWSVADGDISDHSRPIEAVRQEIRERYIREATVTIVLVGACTWQRMHVDWEIASSLRHTESNPRCGLIGIVLPSHIEYGTQPNLKNLALVPPRLADNCTGQDPFAAIYDWPRRRPTRRIRLWIDEAFKRRNSILPNNRRTPYGVDMRGDCSLGWQG